MLDDHGCSQENEPFSKRKRGFSKHAPKTVVQLKNGVIKQFQDSNLFSSIWGCLWQSASVFCCFRPFETVDRDLNGIKGGAGRSINARRWSWWNGEACVMLCICVATVWSPAIGSDIHQIFYNFKSCIFMGEPQTHAIPGWSNIADRFPKFDAEQLTHFLWVFLRGWNAVLQIMVILLENWFMSHGTWFPIICYVGSRKAIGFNTKLFSFGWFGSTLMDYFSILGKFPHVRSYDIVIYTSMILYPYDPHYF